VREGIALVNARSRLRRGIGLKTFMRILVTDAEQRSALAVVRSLGRAGHKIVTCSHAPRPLAASSRYVSSHVHAANPLLDQVRFVDDLVAAIRTYECDVVFPVTEQAHIAILTQPERLAGVCVPSPDADVFLRVADKEAVLGAAKAVGIATPNQIRLDAPNVAGGALPDNIPFPVVLKPARSVVGGAKHVVRYAADQFELERQLGSLPPEAFPVLAQQRVVGPGVGIFLLIWNGQTLAVFSHRRLRENPPSGGGSVYSESTAADERLVEQARRLLEHFSWRGLAMIEFKIDRATGTPYLMEINGRVWGSLQLAIDAGVDFPALLVAAACGRPSRASSQYRIGVRLRSWWPDVDHLLARVRHSPARLSLPPDAPDRSTVIRDFFRWRRGDRMETFRFHDPAPFFRDSADWIRRRVGF